MGGVWEIPKRREERHGDGETYRYIDREIKIDADTQRQIVR